MASITNMARKWRRILKAPGVGLSFALVWLLGLALALVPAISPPVALALSFSAGLLARGRESFEAMVRAAISFWLYWTTLGLYLALLGLAVPKSPADLAAKLALGLHLVLVWTPMELGLALKKALGIFLGQKRASAIALGLVVMLKTLQGLTLEARMLRATLAARASGLSYFTRLALLARNLLRLESQRPEELARAISSRKARTLPDGDS
ncbi:MAG: hypothetical protein LBU69_03985 [Deltaproteobacteria bacterium]|jgi:hypothetical protein|nr:hypothetical protein [Deltaproteobacteria bacterium]